VPLLDTYCNNCHSAALDGGPWALGGYENVRDWRELMIIDLLDCSIPGLTQGHPMPPPDAPLALPTASHDVITTWLLCGAPKN
jgi:hypothetical protein